MAMSVECIWLLWKMTTLWQWLWFKKCDVQVIHNMLGHVFKAMVWESANLYGWMLKNKMTNCNSGVMAKSHQKNVPKTAMKKSKMPGEQLFIDISHPQSHSFGGSNIGFWLLMMQPIIVFLFSWKQRISLAPLWARWLKSWRVQRI